MLHSHYLLQLLLLLIIILILGCYYYYYYQYEAAHSTEIYFRILTTYYINMVKVKVSKYTSCRHREWVEVQVCKKWGGWWIPRHRPLNVSESVLVPILQEDVWVPGSVRRTKISWHYQSSNSHPSTPSESLLICHICIYISAFQT